MCLIAKLLDREALNFIFSDHYCRKKHNFTAPGFYYAC